MLRAIGDEQRLLTAYNASVADEPPDRAPAGGYRRRRWPSPTSSSSSPAPGKVASVRGREDTERSVGSRQPACP